MIQRVKTIRLFPANWESKFQNNEFCAENIAAEGFQLGSSVQTGTFQTIQYIG